MLGIPGVGTPGLDIPVLGTHEQGSPVVGIVVLGIPVIGIPWSTECLECCAGGMTAISLSHPSPPRPPCLFSHSRPGSKGG